MTLESRFTDCSPGTNLDTLPAFINICSGTPFPQPCPKSHFSLLRGPLPPAGTHDSHSKTSTCVVFSGRPLHFSVEGWWLPAVSPAHAQPHPVDTMARPSGRAGGTQARSSTPSGRAPRTSQSPTSWVGLCHLHPGSPGANQHPSVASVPLQTIWPLYSHLLIEEDDGMNYKAEPGPEHLLEPQLLSVKVQALLYFASNRHSILKCQ